MIYVDQKCLSVCGFPGTYAFFWFKLLRPLVDYGPFCAAGSFLGNFAANRDMECWITLARAIQHCQRSNGQLGVTKVDW